MKLENIDPEKYRGRPLADFPKIWGLNVKNSLRLFVPNTDEIFDVCDRVSTSHSDVDNQKSVLVRLDIPCHGDEYPLFHQQNNGYGVSIRVDERGEMTVWEGYTGNARRVGAWIQTTMSVYDAIVLAGKVGFDFATKHYSQRTPFVYDKKNFTLTLVDYHCCQWTGVSQSLLCQSVDPTPP